MTDDFRIRFLIVDDEQSIRKLCVTIGASLGFLCAEAENAEAALAYLEKQVPGIGLTDLMLPNMTGRELLRLIEAQYPRNEVGVMSGQRSNESPVHGNTLVLSD